MTLIRTLISALSEELIAQGHRNTGALIKSFEGRVRPDKLGVEIWGEKYAHYLDKGVKWYQKSKRPPIAPLIEYFKQKGAADPKAAAFATINVWKNKSLAQGMPTRNSYRPSITKTGERKHFIREALKKNRESIDRELLKIAVGKNSKMDKKINKIFNQIEFHGGGTGVGGGGIWIF